MRQAPATRISTGTIGDPVPTEGKVLIDERLKLAGAGEGPDADDAHADPELEHQKK